MVLDKDFREFIGLLNANSVRYLVVGGIAVAFHGYPRYTKDLDVWIDVSLENAQNLLNALSEFGFGSLGLTEEDFLTEGEFTQLGYPPYRIDLITGCEGVNFAACYTDRNTIEIDGVEVNFIDLDNLRRNKVAVGRPQDMADVANLKPA